MQYPEGYLESLEEKQKAAFENASEKKRKNDDSSESKKRKKIAYTLSSKIVHLIQLDKVNKKFWDECLEAVSNGQQEFLKKVENAFSCICCQEVVFIKIQLYAAITYVKSFKAGVFSCPMRRQELQKTCINDTNKNLQNVLLCLFPGYDAGR
ncbi:hypothetical protein CDAR_12161 [Caerostris darwini]|uniref:Uncharacterized protein n=1 Tax=Caerostris darwini TaxID=1538125 RepID=A0AAV4RTI3_9ARAC|nr:hypothetical protein CDAR_12161 [Caerostris darwini]